MCANLFKHSILKLQILGNRNLTIATTTKKKKQTVTFINKKKVLSYVSKKKAKIVSFKMHVSNRILRGVKFYAEIFYFYTIFQIDQ